VRRVFDRAVIAVGVAVGLLLVAYTVYFFVTPRSFAEAAGQLQPGMSKREVLDIMRYPPGRYRRPLQGFRGHSRPVVVRPGPPGPPSYSFHRWHGSDVSVCVGYDEHGRVNSILVYPVP
jgi:hypothetical protein